jgi:hypothetical protein
MFDAIKDIIPTEQFGPGLLGLVVWFGANYGYVAPEIVMPRAMAMTYQPACERLLAEGNLKHQERRRTIAEAAQEKLSKEQERALQIGKEITTQGLELWLGKEGAKELEPFSSTMTELALRAEMLKRQSQTPAALASAEVALPLRSNEEVCRCILNSAMDERLDLALYTASLRIYRPPTIANLESGALFDNSTRCKAPIAQGN